MIAFISFSTPSFTGSLSGAVPCGTLADPFKAAYQVYQRKLDLSTDFWKNFCENLQKDRLFDCMHICGAK
jgi:hypothetical protein